MNDHLRTSANGLALVKHFEGFRSQAYLCPANVWTIGYGTTSGVRRGQVITEGHASTLLAQDLARFEQTVRNHVRVILNQHQFDALVAFVYNVGGGNFRSSTLLKKLNEGRYDEVPAQMARWNKGGGRILQGLVRRRAAEGTLFSSGRLAF